MTSIIAGLVLRSNDKKLLSRFYSDIGISMRDSTHAGPKHYEFSQVDADFVLEIYSRSDLLHSDALMVLVESLTYVIDVARGYNITPESKIKETENLLFVYMRDPDGRMLMLVQKK